MARLKYVVTCFLMTWGGFLVLAQDSLSIANPDFKYREDQFYAGITYNLVTRVPNAINLDGISGGVRFGFLRDMPINDERNVAIAVGAGLAFDRYGQTLFIGEDVSENSIFDALNSDVSYSKNRFSTAEIEIPIEFRWRTSTTDQYKFWRIYGGAKLVYTYWYQSFFQQTGNEVSQTDIPEFQNVRLAATLALGYGTFNFYAHYSLTPFFKDATISSTSEEVAFAPLKVGLVFYIL